MKLVSVGRTTHTHHDHIEFATHLANWFRISIAYTIQWCTLHAEVVTHPLLLLTEYPSCYWCARGVHLLRLPSRLSRLCDSRWFRPRTLHALFSCSTILFRRFLLAAELLLLLLLRPTHRSVRLYRFRLLLAAVNSPGRCCTNFLFEKIEQKVFFHSYLFTSAMLGMSMMWYRRTKLVVVHAVVGKSVTTDWPMRILFYEFSLFDWLVVWEDRWL